MITVTCMDQVAGQWINDAVQVLAPPTFDETSQRWRALANAYGMLAIVELRVTTPEKTNEQMRTP